MNRGTGVQFEAFRSSRMRSGGGFTLMEVLVTMLLMAIVLPVAMRGISVATSVASTARHKAEAATLGQAKLNAMMTDAVILGDATALTGSGNFGDAWPEYKWTSQSIDNTDLGLLQITFTIEWQQAGAPRSIDLMTMLQYPDTTLTSTGTSTTGTP